MGRWTEALIAGVLEGSLERTNYGEIGSGVCGERVRAVEVVAPVDALRRGGVDVVLAAVSDDLTVRAAQAVTLQADAPLSTLDLTQFDIAIVPGGSVGVDNLGKSQRVVAELTRRMEAGEYVAAICAGPMVLANAGLLTGARPCATRAARKAGRPTSTRRARTSSSMETLSLPRAPHGAVLRHPNFAFA